MLASVFSRHRRSSFSSSSAAFVSQNGPLLSQKRPCYRRVLSHTCFDPDHNFVSVCPSTSPGGTHALERSRRSGISRRNRRSRSAARELQSGQAGRHRPRKPDANGGRTTQGSCEKQCWGGASVFSLCSRNRFLKRRVTERRALRNSRTRYERLGEGGLCAPTG